MPLDVALLTLLHLLVFAYWLGGDLGVFYSSFLLTDSKRDVAGRLAAGKILADVDLAPRICLLLALPTGLALADAKDWVNLPVYAHAAAFAVALLWVSFVVQLHAKHGPPKRRRVDLGLRILFCVGLAATGISALAGGLALPLFLAVKILLLAFCVLMGLLVRVALTPFGPAFVALATSGPTAEGDAAIRGALDRARPFVVAIWISLTLAAVLGVATPQ